MKFLFFFSALLLLSVQSRPSSFKNDNIPKDADGFIRYDGPAPVSLKRSDVPVAVPYLFFEGKVNSGVISFDSDVQEIDSIQCAADQTYLTFNLTENQEPPTWENGTTIIGGLEWECTNSNGVPVAIAVIVQGPTLKVEGSEGFYSVQTRPAESQEIYSNLTFIVNPPKRRRDDTVPTQRHNWNKDESTGVAAERILLAQSDCSSSGLQKETQEFCENGGDYHATAVCSNCWMTHDFTLSYKDCIVCLSPYARLSTVGRVEANLEIELEVQALFSDSKRISFKVPIVGFNFHVIRLDFYLEPALDLSTSFSGQGKATFGAGLTASYQGEYGTDEFSTIFGMGELKTYKSLNANGHATAKAGLIVSPTAVVFVGSIMSASASVTVGPYVQANAEFSSPSPLEARNSLPKVDVSFPTSDAVCRVPHIAEYNVTFGLEVTADAEWKALSKSSSKHWDLYKSEHGLTSGCLGAVQGSSSSSGTRSVKLYFPSTSSIGKISSEAFSKLLSQDLTKILGVSFSALGDINVQSQTIAGKTYFAASVTFLESDLTAGALSAASKLDEISKDTSSISRMSSNLSVSNQMVNDPTPQNNQQNSNGLVASPSNVLLPCLWAMLSVLCITFL
eukprot:TRINITY_DN6918_c0_g1_i2.p1 TRINITY_DN6918_c0_g1~~TRINITY_DN6918_c0_g1_i2.p1  ORF type:complete len:620 (-),score=153.42 TRINITY_DN6918_c0_g1_i2:173-2032(-)